MNRVVTGTSAATPHFNGFLHHVVQPRVLERREHIVQVGETVLFPGLADDLRAVRPLAARERGLPFAVAAVEDQHGVARRQPQHIAEVVGLVAVKRDAAAGGQRRIDEKTGTAEVEFWHQRDPFMFRLLTQWLQIGSRLRGELPRCCPIRRVVNGRRES